MKIDFAYTDYKGLDISMTDEEVLRLIPETMSDAHELTTMSQGLESHGAISSELINKEGHFYLDIIIPYRK